MSANNYEETPPDLSEDSRTLTRDWIFSEHCKISSTNSFKGRPSSLSLYNESSSTREPSLSSQNQSSFKSSVYSASINTNSSTNGSSRFELRIKNLPKGTHHSSQSLNLIDYSMKGYKNVTKSLLAAASSVMSLEELMENNKSIPFAKQMTKFKNEFFLYVKYLQTYTLTTQECNMSLLHRRISKCHAFHLFYKIKEPENAPKYFDIMKHSDIIRLSLIIEHKIIVYVAPNGDNNNFSDLLILQDFRWFEQNKSKNWPCLHLVYTPSGLLFKSPIDLTGNVKKNFLDLLAVPNNYFTENPLDFKVNLSLKRLRAISAEITLDLYEDLVEVSKVLINNYPELFGLEISEKYPCSLTGYVRNKNNISNCCVNSKIKNKFFIKKAKIFKPDKMSYIDFTQHSEAEVFIVWFKNCVKANKNVSQQYFKQLINTYENNDKLSNTYKPNFDNVAYDCYLECVCGSCSEEKKAKQEARKKQANDRTFQCQCPICISTDYERNIRPSKKENNCTVELSTFSLLKILGLSNFAPVIEQVLDCNIGAFDIESKTIPLNMEKPNEVPIKKPFDEIIVPNHPIKTQLPIMVCYMDKLSEQDPVVFTVKNDSEDAIDEMFSQFWDYIVSSVQKIQDHKSNLLKPLFDILDQYKECHYNFYEKYIGKEELEYYIIAALKRRKNKKKKKELLKAFNEKSDRKELKTVEESCRNKLAESTWEKSLFGQLEKKLIYIQKAFWILSFFG